MLCKCGATITDIVALCPTEGDLLGEQEFELLDERFVSRVDDFLSAMRAAHREQWISEQFGPEYLKLNLSDGEIISTILMREQLPFGRSVAECAVCGRLHVQAASRRNEYLTFAPDVPGYQGVLKAATDHVIQ